MRLTKQAEYFGHNGCESEDWVEMPVCLHCHTILLIPQEELDAWSESHPGENSLVALNSSWRCCDKPSFIYSPVIRVKLESL